MMKQRANLLAFLLVAVVALAALGGSLSARLELKTAEPAASASDRASGVAEGAGAALSGLPEAPSSSSPEAEPPASSSSPSGPDGQTPSSSSAAPAPRPDSSPEPPASSSQPEEAPLPPLPPPSGVKGKYLVGYYAGWARSQGFSPLDVDASKLTHINYAFANVTAGGKLQLTNPAADRKNFEDLRALKRRNPGLVTLLSVGGWDYSSNFSSAAATPQTRAAFAQSCLDFVLEHGFDGVDVDWEFPRARDRENFTLLLRAVREAFNEQSARDGRRYYLTIAAGVSQSSIRNMQPQSVAALVDFIFLMGYDMHGPWDSYADLTAPLYPADEDTPHYANSLSQVVRAYRSAGIPASKLVLGMPFYGYRYSTDGSTENGLFSPFSSGHSVSFDRVRSSYLDAGDFEQFYHPNARVPFLFDGSTFISYDDEDSIAEKVAFARESGLLGVGAWELSHDRSATLLSAAYHALR